MITVRVKQPMAAGIGAQAGGPSSALALSLHARISSEVPIMKKPIAVRAGIGVDVPQLYTAGSEAA